MSLEAKYVHTNICAKDWKKLAIFYKEIFGCIPVPPERDLSGEWIEKGTAVKNAHIVGVHLKLPGYTNDGPTLEIFQYNNKEEKITAEVNRPGFTHIAFSVNDVYAAVEVVLKAGGSKVGEIVSHNIPGAGTVIFAYLRDPEGNIIELQSWK